MKLSQLKDVEVAEGSPRGGLARSRLRTEGSEGPAGADDEVLSIAAMGAHAAPGGARVVKETHPVHLRTKADVFAFIEEERQRFGVTRLCRLFAVTRAGFYAWRHRPVSARRRQDRDLLEDVRAIFERSGRTHE